MRAVDLIRKKRDGEELTDPEISWLVEGLATGEVAQYQWSALLMAIFYRSMTDSETASLTAAMMNSGIVVDLSGVAGRKVDKHSTGGVGDKTSLILAPIAAACGVRVPMVSGRGLGHTGGTLDKLESIPGFNVHLNLAEYQATLEACGMVLIGQTAEIAPADKALYALRDATATVESIPLITASIMSKKLAEGIDGLVLDVKTGDGAFMQKLEDSIALAESMCSIGRKLGKEMVALITRMDQPLGRAVGNSLEIAECVECLRGGGAKDLVDLSVELAAEMVLMARLSPDIASARAFCRESIADGSALATFRCVIEAQGGDPRVVDDSAWLPQASKVIDIVSPATGYVRSLGARAVGQATMLLGAGRARVDSKIDPAVGVLLHKKVGDAVQAGEPLCTVLANKVGLDQAIAMIRDAYAIGDAPATPDALIVQRL